MLLVYRVFPVYDIMILSKVYYIFTHSQIIELGLNEKNM
jgi:hypothetical protein